MSETNPPTIESAVSVKKSPVPRPGIQAGVISDELKQFISRIETIEMEKLDKARDIRDVYAEAKGRGYDVKIMRKIIQRRKLSTEQRAEQDELLDLYQHAIGMSSQRDLFAPELANENKVN
jgi:uncharacterized protein (UPF0335 family)